MHDDMPTSLYRFFDADGDLLYVGISLSLPERLRAHSLNKAWWFAVTKIEVVHYPTRDDALDAERAAIRTERPRWNITCNSDVPSGRPQGNTQSDLIGQLAGQLAAANEQIDFIEDQRSRLEGMVEEHIESLHQLSKRVDRNARGGESVWRAIRDQRLTLKGALNWMRQVG